MLYDEEATRPVGLVPVEGRGSLPFALLHGESLVAVASWAMGEAGVDLLDFTASWTDVLDRGATLVLHDPLCAGTPVGFVREAIEAATGGVVVVGVRPVTDTVRSVDDAGVLGETADRSSLVAVASPVVIPPDVLAMLSELPPVADLADLVVALRVHHAVLFVEAPPTARRVSDESDLRLLEALTRPD